MHRKFSITVIFLVLLSLIGSSVALAQDDPSQRTRAERAEIRFLEGMIDHHQMALDMAADCLVKAETEAVRTLCQNVITAQSSEILTMRGWLLAWYHIDYQPMSMTQMAGSGDPGMGMGMMGDDMGMGMMDGDMMAQMMEMMMGMMSNGMGMMGGGMAGGQGSGGMSGDMTNDMQMMQMMNILYAMQNVTLGDLIGMTTDVDPTTPFVEVLRDYVNNRMADAAVDMMGMMSTLENMSMGQMMVIFAQLSTLTLADVQEIMGHLESPENMTIMELIQHHIEATLNDTAVDGSATGGNPAGGDHEAHHPERNTTNPQATQEPGMDMGNMNNGQGGGHSDHATGSTPTTGFSDPAMMMGMFAGFNYLTGVDYEIAWLEAMIDHHDDALHMSNRILGQAVHEELATLAQAIIDAQTAEIAEMEALLAELGGA